MIFFAGYCQSCCSGIIFLRHQINIIVAAATYLRTTTSRYAERYQSYGEPPNQKHIYEYLATQDHQISVYKRKKRLAFYSKPKEVKLLTETITASATATTVVSATEGA